MYAMSVCDARLFTHVTLCMRELCLRYVCMNAMYSMYVMRVYFVRTFSIYVSFVCCVCA